MDEKIKVVVRNPFSFKNVVYSGGEILEISREDFAILKNDVEVVDGKEGKIRTKPQKGIDKK